MKKQARQTILKADLILNNQDILTEIYKFISDPACIVSGDFAIVDFNPQFEKKIHKVSNKESFSNLRCVFSDEILQKIKVQISNLMPGSVLSLKNIPIKIINGTEKLIDIHLVAVSEETERNDNFLIILKNCEGDAFAEQLSSGVYKMAILGMLAGGVSHDINNKLSVILGYSGLAGKRAVGNEKLESDLKAITGAAHDATNLMQSLVKYCRSKDGEKRSIRLGILAKEIMRVARYVLPSSIEVSLKIDNQCGYVVTDPVALNDLFNLLISECLHVLKNGGEFTVAIRVQKQMGQFSEKKINLGFDYRISRKDVNAMSSTPVTLRSDTLNLVDMLVSKLGCLRSGETDNLENNVSLRFVFEEDPGEQAVYFEKSSVRDVTGKENILLVEDEEMLASLLIRALRRSGYSVTLASDGDEGYRKWQSAKGAYDLILTDMTMPGLSGVELAEKIIKSDSTAKIILCTGFSDQVDEERALKVGIKAYLSKPVSNSVLMESIRSCLDA